MSKLIAKSLRLGSGRYSDMSLLTNSIANLKSEISEAMTSMEGKPDEMTITKVTHNWNCTADGSSLITELENPSRNKFYRFAAIIVKFQPLLLTDPGTGVLNILNESISKDKRFLHHILSIPFNCNEHCVYIAGSEQWIDSEKGKISVVSQCSGSIAKPGTKVMISDVVVVYQHSSRPKPIKPIPTTKRACIMVEDNINNYLEPEVCIGTV
uniref:Uncharacterized protein n=1 Tax=Melon chlorotic spot virus TaxID=2479459 RepID=A0A481T0N2_9VIRU|nr:hypothetical protein [Melon chlorotic spot virus]